MSISTRSVCSAAAAALVAVATAGCGLSFREFSDSFTERGNITEIAVTGGSGDVTVRPGAAGQVDIARTVRYWHDSPADETHHMSGTVLQLSTDCGQRCSVSYVIQAPRGVRVTGENGSGDLNVTAVSTVDFTVGSGDLTVRDATGPVRVQTGSGDIDLTGIAGTVSATTGSGDVQGRDLKPDGLIVDTSSGDISLTLTTVANVRAESGSGDVRLTVPTGDYLVDAHSGSGDVALRIANNPSGTHRLQVQTGSGDITVTPT